ncbi:MAG: heme exporter protein CcmD [Meiothermus sp.]|uniref:heme exporter protein CcmD n=1 Tax=Meiothermus sp. TaxID=1955249 RepID=UPI0025FA507C|nr:heme exporter protein CcmD [Meiothermus sp.]MCS7068395.1 heme exporter protein CcmD [Meiothermus sp.]MCX7600661.1 heme exporter protein CcmD [Meiothermus sp.]
MQAETFGMVFFAVTALIVLALAWLMPLLKRRRQEQELRALERMHRFALKHNTFVRNHSGVRYVVVLGQQGFYYMLGGQFVSRERLLKALGEEHEKQLLKAEGEESRHGPTLSLITFPA